jgi:D-aspartate ligase
MAEHTPRSSRSSVGAVIIGGQHPGLGVVRSLGRRGIPTLVVDDRASIASLSRYVGRSVGVDDLLDERRTVDALLDVGRRFQLRNWVLFPTRDETVAAISRHRAELAEFFTLTTPDWNCIQWAWDKKKSYELATRLGIPCPATFNPLGVDDLPSLYPRLPLAIKPAIKEHFFYETGAKAWRANTPEELNAAYARARRLIAPPEILVQEIIPGDGCDQYSYCALCHDGGPPSVMTARRERQHPREFGRAATYVETIELPDIESLAERFLKSIEYRGLVEIEFKQDPRDGQYKLLDVNARIWGFHALGIAAGVDFAYLQFAAALGAGHETFRAQPAIGWLRLVTDIPTALAGIATGRLSAAAYFRSLRNTRIESTFSLRDPLPGLAEPLLLPCSALAGQFRKRRAATSASRARPIGFTSSSEVTGEPS